MGYHRGTVLGRLGLKTRNDAIGKVAAETLTGRSVVLLMGALGASLGALSGLSLGGTFILAAIAGSASHIDAPAAVRSSIPQANPSIYLTSSLGISLPFNLLIGLPLLFAYSQWFCSTVVGCAVLSPG